MFIDKQKEIIMKQWFSANVVAIVSLLGTIIIGLSSIAWSNEKKIIYKDISTVKVESQMQDSLLWCEWKSHEKKHEDEEVQRLERERLERLYFDAKFEGLERLILSTNK